MTTIQINHHCLTLVFGLANGITNGGVSTWAMSTCLRLTHQGHRALLLVHKPAAGQEELRANPEIEIIHSALNASEAPLTGAKLRQSAAQYAAVPYSAYFPNWSWSTWASVAACLRPPRLHPCRVIGIGHTDEELYYQIMAYYEPIISKFIAVSDTVSAKLKQQLPHRSNDIVRLSYPLTTTIGTARNHHARQELRIGYAGRIQDYQKRITDLKALAARLSSMPGMYHFEIAGDGTHLAELKQHFKDVQYDNVQVRFHGLLDSCAMPQFWADVDAAILFSSHEGLSIAMIESMAAGCVQFVTDVSGVSDSVQDGVNGFVHAIGDTAAMAEHLSVILHDPERLSRMSQACIDHVMKHHDAAQYDDSLLALVREAWQEPQRSWPRWKPCIPQSVIAEHRRRSKQRINISWKGHLKLALVRLKDRLREGLNSNKLR